MADDLSNYDGGFIDQAEVEEFMNKLTRAEFGPLVEEPEYVPVRPLLVVAYVPPKQPARVSAWIATNAFMFSLIGQAMAFGLIWPILALGVCICLGYKVGTRIERPYDDFAMVFIVATAMAYALWWLCVAVMRPFFV